MVASSTGRAEGLGTIGRPAGRSCGRFVLSINVTPGAREVFDRLAIDEAETTYTIGTVSGGGKRVGKLIVSKIRSLRTWINALSDSDLPDASR